MLLIQLYHILHSQERLKITSHWDHFTLPVGWDHHQTSVLRDFVMLIVFSELDISPALLLDITHPSLLGFILSTCVTLGFGFASIPKTSYHLSDFIVKWAMLLNLLRNHSRQLYFWTHQQCCLWIIWFYAIEHSHMFHLLKGILRLNLEACSSMVWQGKRKKSKNQNFLLKVF